MMRAFFAVLALVATGTFAGTPLDSSYADFIRQGAVAGPSKIALRDQAVLDLPAGYAFLPEATGREFMKRIGNQTDKNFLGIVIPDQMGSWFIDVDFIPDGYIKDDDAKNWNPDELLANIRKSTEKDNERRRASKETELEILGWIEKPHYDAKNHRLIWSIAARNKNDKDTAHNIINYRTLALGRDGYIAMVMVTDLSAIPAQKPIAISLLSHLSFDSGKRYGDYNASTDKVAEYGLAALIGGIAVKKLGLFALIAAFLAKGAKLIGVVVLGGMAWFRRLFRRKATTAIEPAMPVASPPHDGPFSK